MWDSKFLKRMFSRSSGAVLALAVALAWCAPGSAAPKRVGNAGAHEGSAAEEAAAPEDASVGDDAGADGASADDANADDAPAPASSKKPKRVGNADADADAGEAEMPAEENPDTNDSGADTGAKPSDELIEDEKEAGEAKQGADAGKPASGSAAEEPAAPAEGGPTKPAPKKIKEKKGKDFVGKRDQKKDDKGVYRFESGAYLISTDVPKELANDIAAHMDAVYKEYFSRLRNFRPNPYAAVKPNEKMPLYVMKRYRDYLSLLQGFGFNAANSGGVFFRSRTGSGLATWVEGQSRLKMYYVLQHEGFHQFADARLMGSVILANGTIVELPPWVNEGLAEYFGDAVMVKNKLIIGRLDRERLSRMKRGIKEEITLPFRELLTMDNDRWVARVTGGDKASSLMYDNAWSVCYFLIHGNKKQRAAMENYLLTLNRDFVTDPSRDPRPNAFARVFGNNLGNFEKGWKAGVARMEPDSWFTSVRHLQWMAAALKAFHDQEIEVRNWPHLKEQLIRHKFKATIRERDIVARGERKEQVEHVEQNFNFPDPAQVEFIKSEDPRLPDGLLITHVSPNILLSWSINADGVLEEDISYLDPPRGQVTKKKPAPVARRPEAEMKAAPAKKPELSKPATKPAVKGGAGGKPGKKGTIKIGS